MKNTTKAFIFASSLTVALGGLGLAACSSSPSAGVNPGTDSGSDSSTDGGGGGDSSTDSMSLDAQADCKPATLHVPAADAGVYCPFSQSGGTKGGYCAVGQFCCKPSKGLSAGVCTAAGTGGASPCATTDLSLQCDDQTQCNAGNGGPACCGTGTLGQDPACVGTQAYYASGFKGTKCQATCGAGEMQMCEQPAQCEAGTCTAFKAKGGQFGACQ